MYFRYILIYFMYWCVLVTLWNIFFGVDCGQKDRCVLSHSSICSDSCHFSLIALSLPLYLRLFVPWFRLASILHLANSQISLSPETFSWWQFTTRNIFCITTWYTCKCSRKWRRCRQHPSSMRCSFPIPLCLTLSYLASVLSVYCFPPLRTGPLSYIYIQGQSTVYRQ